jgi:molecular chaperone GrpE
MLESEPFGEAAPPPPPPASEGVDGAVTPNDWKSGGSATVVDPPGTSSAPNAALEEQREKYLRLAAEYDNYRKRSLKEREDAEARGQGTLVGKLIEALDDLARFAHVDPAVTDSTTVVEGAQMVERKLLKTLGNAGLEVLNPVDEQFDPARHEAVSTEPAVAAEDDHTVARVYQPGYLFNGQLLRPARVAVRQWNG